MGVGTGRVLVPILRAELWTLKLLWRIVDAVISSPCLTITLRPGSAPAGYGSLTPFPHPLPVSSICLGLTSVMGASTMLHAAMSPSLTWRASIGSEKKTHRW